MPYRWKDFTLDISTASLSQHGKRIEVTPKVIDCIGHLMQHRERIVTYDELVRLLWGHDNATNQQLAQVVLAARRVLGDDGQRQACIRTVQGRGYHWVGDPPQEIAAEAFASTPDPATQPSGPASSPSAAPADDAVALQTPALPAAGDAVSAQAIGTASASPGRGRPPAAGMRRFAVIGSAMLMGALLGGSAILQAHADHAETPALSCLSGAVSRDAAPTDRFDASGAERDVSIPGTFTTAPAASGLVASDPSMRHVMNGRGK